MTYHTTDSDDDGIVDADVDATSVSSSSFNLPSGYTIDEDGSNNLVIRDTSGTIVLTWDDTNSKWTTANLDVDIFNGADIANAVSGEFPEAQGDGTLSMASPGGGLAPQGYEDVQGSRSEGTTYQNTTGVPIELNIGATIEGTTGRLSTGPDSNTDNTVAIVRGVIGEDSAANSVTNRLITRAIVPDGYYYHFYFVYSQEGTINSWWEQKLMQT